MIYAIKLAYDRFVELGVPKDALFSFLMGHLRVQVAITFGLIDAKFYDGDIIQRVGHAGLLAQTDFNFLRHGFKANAGL